MNPNRRFVDIYQQAVVDRPSQRQPRRAAERRSAWQNQPQPAKIAAWQLVLFAFITGLMVAFSFSR